MEDAVYKKGDQVRLVRDASKVGVVEGATYDSVDECWWYRVSVDGRFKELEAEDIEAIGGELSQAEHIAKGSLRPSQALRTLLTAERLRKPAGAVGRAFGSARAKLFPYQYKPLVKFIESPSRSILIADEVGLGKTIEAGYILQELSEREKIDRVLVLVPARLRTKWKLEMQRRFERRFDVVGAREIRELLAREQTEKAGEGFFWIASYESLRRPGIVDGLNEVRPQIDLIVLDEAHRVRNKATAQYKLAAALCASADAKVFLTATPVQTQIENLHTLLDLLKPTAFGDVKDFADRMEANRPIVRAAHLAGLGLFEKAAVELDGLSTNDFTRGLAAQEYVQALRADLRARGTPSLKDRVKFQAVISDLNWTGDIITRTRKVDVIEGRAKRVAQVVTVELSEQEQEIYRAVEQITRLMYPSNSSWGQNMARLTAFRYTASCIPAALDYMREKLLGHGYSARELGDELEMEVLEEEGRSEDLEALTEEQRGCIRKAFRLRPTPEQDSKLVGLMGALRGIWQDDLDRGRPRRKVVLFSFFKRTLQYLGEQLDDSGIGNTVIHGGVDLVEREERIECFLRDTSTDVLLSSEVGGEGLDLQRASVVVNYDLPWNPMVVEQRIGRVDRIGQESPTIVVLNLVCKDTVEDRVLQRLYERIDLFRNSIGEMEDILGASQVRELIIASLKGNLSEREQEEMIEQTASAARMRRQNAEDLSEHVDGLVAADQLVLDEIQKLVDGNRLPDDADILALVQGCFETRYLGCRIHGDPLSGVAQLALSERAMNDFRAWIQQHALKNRARGALRQGELPVTVNADVAMASPSVEFLQARHPLVAFALDQYVFGLLEEGNCFAASVGGTGLAPGLWLGIVSSLARHGYHKTTELICSAAFLDGEAPVVCGESAEGLLQALLGQPDPMDPIPVVELDEAEGALENAQTALRRLVRSEKRQERALETRRRGRQMESERATLERKVQLKRIQVRNSELRGKADFRLRMDQAKLRKAEQALADHLDRGTWNGEVAIEATEVAVVLVEVLS